MHKLQDLKEMLCEELEEYGSKSKIDTGSLEIVDKLAHAIKNIDKILENEDEYSSAYYNNRGRIGMSYTSRRGRYSGDANLIGELRILMDKAQDEPTRMELSRLISKMERL